MHTLSLKFSSTDFIFMIIKMCTPLFQLARKFNEIIHTFIGLIIQVVPQYRRRDDQTKSKLFSNLSPFYILLTY